VCHRQGVVPDQGGQQATTRNFNQPETRRGTRKRDLFNYLMLINLVFGFLLTGKDDNLMPCHFLKSILRLPSDSSEARLSGLECGPSFSWQLSISYSLTTRKQFFLLF